MFNVVYAGAWATHIKKRSRKSFFLKKIIIKNCLMTACSRNRHNIDLRWKNRMKKYKKYVYIYK